MRVLQINSIIGCGSTGRIAEGIGRVLIENGHESFVAYGRKGTKSKSTLIKIGTTLDIIIHGIVSRLFDKHGFGSINATRKLIKEILRINPDIIHLHILHGYYLNIDILFKFLKEFKKPIIWTQHDCWAFTGHCSHFDYVNCYRWENQCIKCPNISRYPASFFDNSGSNYLRKKELFTGIQKAILVSPSDWLMKHINKSFLKQYSQKTISNGIDLSVFKPLPPGDVRKNYKIGNQTYILSVANVWTDRKGLYDLIKIRAQLLSDIAIVIVGLNKKQIKRLPKGVIGITHTEDISELVALYSAADVFVNPTFVDNFPTTNIEALACGTPVVTYNTGGSPEAIDEDTGFVVEKGDLSGLTKAITIILLNGKEYYSATCRQRAERFYDKKDRFGDYISLYQSLLEKK